MKFVLYYHKNALTPGEILKNVLDHHFNSCELQIFHTLDSLKKRAKQVFDYNEKEIFILLADSRDRLNEFTLLIDLMEGKCLILILPDESRDTLSKAYRLFPRFCTKISSNYDDLCRVLHKMITNRQ